MTFKDGLDNLVSNFKSGKVAMSFSYVPATGKFRSLSFHEPYTWDGEREDVYISFDASDKSVYVSNAMISDFRDETLTMFMGIDVNFIEDINE